MSDQLFIPRYSPKPIEDYSVKAGHSWVGPAYSRILRSDAEAWNLAWVSHPYERHPEHDDEKFTVLVGHTVNMIRNSGEIDVQEKRLPGLTVRGLLRLPPKEFWFAINGDIARRTPLYRYYGEKWLNTVMVRSQAPWQQAYHESGLNIDQASELLRKYSDAHI